MPPVVPGSFVGFFRKDQKSSVILQKPGSQPGPLVNEIRSSPGRVECCRRYSMFHTKRTPQGTNQQLKDGDADRIRRDSKGVADLIWQDLTLPADLWTAVGNVDEVVSKLRSQNKRADVPADRAWDVST